jgi:hypothetical protein
MLSGADDETTFFNHACSDSPVAAGGVGLADLRRR